MADWQTVSSRVAYENPFMRIHEDQAINPAGKQVIYGYCESTEGSAYIIPIDDEGHTYIVRQHRYTLKQNYWEFPAGRIPYSEDIIEGSKRELLEETGLLAEDMVQVGELLSTPGITNFVSKIFLARNLTKTSSNLDVNDGISELKRVSQDEVRDMIIAGKIQCSTSIAGFYLALAYYNKG